MEDCNCNRDCNVRRVKASACKKLPLQNWQLHDQLHMGCTRSPSLQHTSASSASSPPASCRVASQLPDVKAQVYCTQFSLLLTRLSLNSLPLVPIYSSRLWLVMIEPAHQGLQLKGCVQQVPWHTMWLQPQTHCISSKLYSTISTEHNLHII